MAFNSIPYLVLLFGTLLLYFSLPPKGRLTLLIFASLLFYSFWSVPLVSLIVISAVTDYLCGLSIGRSESSRKRRFFLLVSLGVNLGLLAYFKYSNFFLENVHALLGDTSQSRFLSIVLPPGISFYTFQTMSYTIDVYRRHIEPTRSFLRFFLYVSFFPQLVAGPIERAGRLLTQFDHAAHSRFSSGNFISGGRMIIWGLFKKVLIADTCGVIADRAYGSPELFDGWSFWVATYAFTLQIYCDFSAYSEIARGSARLFGIDLMRNFDQPYLTTNIGAFWRRWHISLSTWIRDYIYFPLGGSRGTTGRTIFNLLLTFFLSGLWHGAAWNFVLWGLLQGVFLVVYAAFSDRKRYLSLRDKAGKIWIFAGWFLTLHLAVTSWILFRASSLSDINRISWKMISVPFSGTGPTLDQFGFILFFFLFMLGSHLERRHSLIDHIHRRQGVSLAFYAGLIVLMLLLGKSGGPQFIYFQF